LTHVKVIHLNLVLQWVPHSNPDTSKLYEKVTSKSPTRIQNVYQLVKALPRARHLFSFLLFSMKIWKWHYSVLISKTF